MIGQTLDRYRIESKLGEGGMGVVYKARDTQLGRAVAIKILPHDKVADADRKLRFIQEAKAASSLNHSGIVTIHDIRTDAGIDFIVMELVEGKTLDQMISDKGLPPSRALRYAVEIADALAKAHGAGIIHRDLKPSNVMVTTDDRIKILDFGLAKLLERADFEVDATTMASLTGQGMVIGTAAYMSPEQAEGHDVDARSDIFSVGALLYHMVTGRKPFAGESTLKVLANVLNADPIPPRQIASSVPQDLERIIVRCLRKDPARRFQTSTDLKLALEDVGQDSSAPLEPVPAQPARARWIWLAASAVIVLAAAAGWLNWRSGGTAENSEPLRATPLTSLQGVERRPSFSPDADRVAFSWTGPKQNNPTWMPDSEEILFSARGGLWRLNAVNQNAAARLPFVGEDGLMPVVSQLQSGRPSRLVYVRSYADSNIWSVETPAAGAPASSPPKVAFSSTRTDQVPTVSPDGKRVAFVSNRAGESEIWLADADGSNAVPLTSMGAVPGFPRWSPDGELIAFHSNPEGQAEIYVVPAAGGKPRNVTSHPATDAFPSFSRDGKWVYISSNRGGLTTIWKVPTSGGPAVQVTTSVGAVTAESPDGAYLYYAESFGTPSPLWRQPTSGGVAVKILDGVIDVAFAVIDRGIYYLDRPSSETRLQFCDFATRTAKTIATNLGMVSGGLTASADGRLILYSRIDSTVDDLMLVENLQGVMQDSSKFPPPRPKAASARPRQSSRQKHSRAAAGKS